MNTNTKRNKAKVTMSKEAKRVAKRVRWSTKYCYEVRYPSGGGSAHSLRDAQTRAAEERRSPYSGRDWICIVRWSRGDEYEAGVVVAEWCHDGEGRWAQVMPSDRPVTMANIQARDTGKGMPATERLEHVLCNLREMALGVRGFSGDADTLDGFSDRLDECADEIDWVMVNLSDTAKLITKE